MFSFLRVVTQQHFRNQYGYLLAKNNYSTKLSAKEACAVMKSWKMLEKKSEKLAKNFFQGVFDKYPEYAKLFKRFGDCPEEILDNKDFIQCHAVGVVLKQFGKAVKKIDDSCAVKKMMKSIGHKHVDFCMTPEHFKNTRPIMMRAIEKNLCNMNCTQRNGWESALKMIFGGLAKGVKSC